MKQPAIGSDALSLSPEAIPAKGKGKLHNLSPFQREAHRRQQNAAAKRRERAKATGLGDRVLTIRLTASEAELIRSCLDRVAPAADGIAAADAATIRAGTIRKMLIRGAVFMANAGTGRGKKLKGNTDAAAIRGAIADVSAIPQGSEA